MSDTRNLKELFRTTQFGVQDARQISSKSKEFIKSKYGIKVKIKKESENNWYGGKVSGGKQRSITLNIETSEVFDLVDYIKELNECTFTYEENQGKDVWCSSIQDYLIEVKVNNKEVEFGRTLYGIKGVIDDVILKYIFKNEDYSETIKDYYKRDENNNWILK